MVRGQLLLPKSVSKVVEKLRTLYGRPELLLQCQLERVRKLEPPKVGKLASFVPFGIAVEQLCEHLEATELKQLLVNPLLIQDLVDKLPDNNKRDWVRIGGLRSERFYRFKAPSKPVAEFRPGKGNAREKGAVYNHGEGANGADKEEWEKRKPCRACERTDHRLRYCEDFKKLAYADRMKIVDSFRLCQVCLNEHGAAPCKFKLRCNIEGFNCNPLLHSVQGLVSAHNRADNVTLFRMIPVNLHCGERSITVLAFLDEGASVTLVEKSLVDRLGAVGVPEKFTMKWTADIARVEEESRRLNLWTSAIGANEKLLLKTVRTVSKLMLPQQKLNAEELSHEHAHMRGLPISSYNGRPGMLIGLNNIHTFAPIETKIGSVADPIAVRCKLGWTVYGPRQTNAVETSEVFLNVHQEVTDENLYDLLKTHYALEESVVSVPRESAEDERAREILEQTTKRIGDRFETGLRWNKDDPQFPDSYPMALKRLLQLEKKLAKHPVLRRNVFRQIEEYQEKGYAHLATAEELSETVPGKVWYLPLNVVRNPKKPDKVRLIWDAAASVQGVSLNSKLLKGPDMLVPLMSVGFRERRIAFGGDVREMYHQLKMIARDKRFLRFLFRENPHNPPKVYVMDVATFESTSSPCSAQFVKNRNAEEFTGQYPEAAAAIIQRHYVDDYFDSVDTIEEAINRAKQLRNKLLPYLSGNKRPTKRNVLSCVMSFFDTLGMLSPFTVHGKIIVQHLWRSCCDWNEEIGNDCWDLWKRWTGSLSDVENIRISRCYLGNSLFSKVESIELHVFNDASKHAYGCVAFLRVVVEGLARCSLVMSRSKVAPLKRQSIPRLELMAAVLGARLSQTSDSEWFTGPSFLYQSENQWPSSDTQIGNTTAEARGVVLFHEVVTALKKKGLPIITTKATEKQRLLINAQYTSVLQPLSQEEHQKAETILWKQAQFDGFPDEMRVLNKNLELKPGQKPEKIMRSSSIYKLTQGIDYLGPIEVVVGRKKVKRWVAVFTCLAIRAIHFEVVHTLTTQSCMMAIRRFSKAHGVPTEIFSDNATCFRGSANEMHRIHNEGAEALNSATTAWHFNPPATPAMGGIWERMVR
ncbi:uncharacterized protein LOC129720076 [Wyeomyia smithii]|uniref:uncharacterized protein LOC129720076 n=1 Tax=Wyeomyia smithii TaxID=174621 RepID=UPI0024681ACF|nr:uncharacterized protein LOC129720076 [Wyeomyia smithii]